MFFCVASETTSARATSSQCPYLNGVIASQSASSALSAQIRSNAANASGNHTLSPRSSATWRCSRSVIYSRSTARALGVTSTDDQPVRVPDCVLHGERCTGRVRQQIICSKPRWSCECLDIVNQPVAPVAGGVGPGASESPVPRGSPATASSARTSHQDSPGMRMARMGPPGTQISGGPSPTRWTANLVPSAAANASMRSRYPRHPPPIPPGVRIRQHGDRVCHQPCPR